MQTAAEVAAAAAELGPLAAQAPVLFVGAWVRVADNATLPPLPPAFGGCLPLQLNPKLNPP